MTETSNQLPAAPPAPAPPSAPGPGASAYEWREYRRAMHHYWRATRTYQGWYGPVGWGVFFASALILIGVYYVFRNAGLLPWFPEDVFWPLILIVYGASLLLRTAARGRFA